jgi:hypothetical protein
MPATQTEGKRKRLQQAFYTFKGMSETSTLTLFHDITDI